MLRPGVYDADIVSPSPDGVTIKCDPNDGMIAVGSGIARVSGGKQHGSFTRRWDVQKIGGSGTVDISVSGGSLSVMCARWNVPWKYTSWSAVTGHSDTFKAGEQSAVTTEAVVIGFGVGGAAAAAALRLAGVESIAVVHKGASTTEQSTGVMWFPSNSTHTTRMLMEATGSDTANQTMVAQYINDGTAALQFWRSAMDMAQFDGSNPAYDYTQYTSGSVSGNSWQLQSCIDNAATGVTCGAVLVDTLKQIARVDTEIVDTATRIVQQLDGTFRVEVASGKVITSVVVIVATGGQGASQTDDPDLVLATENNGFSTRVQTDLGLGTTTLDDPPRYHVEFITKNAGIKTVRWFAADKCVVKNTDTTYDLCDDYSTRAQAIGLFGSSQAAKSGTYECSDETSGQYWKSFIQTLSEFANYPNCETGTHLYAGMIDTKGGFDIGTTYESTEIRGLFASGTSAAAFTGDAYYGPGATLGLGMITGFVVGPTGRTRIDAWKRRRLVSDQGDGERFAKRVPDLFMASVWVLGVGIVAHLATNGGWIAKESWVDGLRIAHYVLMPTGTILATVAFARAQGGVIASYPNGSAHKAVGTIAFVSIWVQSLFGVWALYRNIKSASTTRFVQVWHRVAGYTILGMVIFLYVSGTQSTAFNRHYQWHHAKEAEQSAYAYAAVTGLAGVFGVYYAWNCAAVSTKSAYSTGATTNTGLQNLL